LLGALCRIFATGKTDAPLPAGQLVTRHALRELQRALDVLLVEDHPANQKLALGLLEKWGHRATLARNGQEALDQFAQRTFDLILMDMQMPVMGGLEATLHIRRLERQRQMPPTPIIAMTAAAMAEDRKACFAAGMDDYLAKPIRTRELLDKLQAFGAQIEISDEKPSAFDYGAALNAADRETVEIIAGIFLDTWQRDIQQLRDSIARHDAAGTERTAHTLKGTLATFAAQPAVRLAAQLESRARHLQMEGMSGGIDLLAHEILALEPYLKLVVARISG